MQQLLGKFLEKQFPLEYKLHVVDDFLRSRYDATEIPKSSMEELQTDPQVNFTQIYRCYDINNRDILNRLYSDFEKSMQEEYRQSHSITYANSEWEKIQSGQLIRVILESNNNDTLTNFTVQGMCMTIVHDLTILKGIPSSYVHVDNLYFTQYLQILKARGYL
ncbi:hypothetical protein [Paenibacillus arenosi]|uniref:Uncharacterized protein n=1 Tax=Paenibacillus arenosi TaxID=2774142 RepID=A0ABR9B698_9BACL|nr:hypothetical protein [Paenibacillus arenosi]MBD8500917.1 hypothetical protein [Paenibacillus arenosi]